MTTTLPHENPSWIQNGEPVSGGVSGNSEGVLNRPLVQLQANVDAVRDAHDTLAGEVGNARGGEANLNARLDGIDSEITDLQNLSTYEDASQAEVVAAQLRDRIPSAFDYAAFQEMAEVVFDETTARNTTQPWTLAVQPLANKTAGFANRIAFIGTPKNLYVDGYKINLDARPASLASAIIDFGTAPVTGSRLDFAFLEVWKEKVVLGAADDVLFPNGAVAFEGTGTFNGCTLFTANASGGNAPAYLASAGGHGAYIKANDANIATFLANPVNNVVKNGDTYYQIRWRIRVHTGVASYLLTQASGDASVKAQGQLAAPSAYGFSTVSGDAGLSRSFNASLALDGYVRAIPVAIVHRRNSTAWSLENPNGAPNVMTGKTHDHIHFNDVCDLRHHGMVDNAYDYKAMYERNLNKILESQLMTTFEPLMSDSDGNGTYKDLNIYGTKLLRMEGLVGSVPFDAGWEVINCATAQNGVKAGLDGIRNYFSDVGGDQVVTGLIPALNADGVAPTSVFSYVAASKTLTFDATDLKSGNDENPSHASRTKISTRQPHLRWGVSGSNMLAAARSLILGLDSVAGTWTGLGGDSASFAVDTVTYFRASCEKVTAGTRVYAGDVYEAVNGVQMTLTHDSGYDSGGYAYVYLFGTFSGPVAPEVGTWTKISGSGAATIASAIGAGINVYPVFYNTTSDLSSMIRYAVYTDGVKQYSVSNLFPATQIVCLNSYPNISDNYFTAPRNVSLTKVSGTGPNTLDITTGYQLAGLGIKRNDSTYFAGSGEKVGLGSNVMPANAPVHVSAYLTFAPGSGFMNRIPHNDNNSFIGCHFNVNGTQVLPNNGVGFIPFGSTVDPLNDGNLPVDSHSRTSNLMGFTQKNIAISSGTGFNEAGASCVIKHGATYKMWGTGWVSGAIYNMFYATSTDSLTWNNLATVLSPGTEPNGYDSVSVSNPCVILDGVTYKLWYIGYDGSNYRVLHSTSANGTTWAVPQLVLQYGTLPNHPTLGWSHVHVIKDGATLKMWLGIQAGYGICYSESADGLSWTTPEQVLDYTSSAATANIGVVSYVDTPRVIKEGSLYKMICRIVTTSGYQYLAYTTSTDGKNWSTIVVFDPRNGTTNSGGMVLPGHCVIKDGSAYKMWYGATPTGGSNHRIFHAVLSMTDTANVGSSTTGVYSTSGSLNCAPPANSQVVVMYEAVADQCDRAVVTGSNLITTLYESPSCHITSLGTGSTLPTWAVIYRDCLTTFAPHAVLAGYTMLGKPYLRAGQPIVLNTPENMSGENLVECVLSGYDARSATSVISTGYAPSTAVSSSAGVPTLHWSHSVPRSKSFPGEFQYRLVSPIGQASAIFVGGLGSYLNKVILDVVPFMTVGSGLSKRVYLTGRPILK